MYGAAYFQFRVAYLMAAGSSFPIERATAVEIREPQAKRNPPTIFRFYCILAVSRRCKKRSRYYEEEPPHANVGLWIETGSVWMLARDAFAVTAWCFRKKVPSGSFDYADVDERDGHGHVKLWSIGRTLINRTLVHTCQNVKRMNEVHTSEIFIVGRWY